MPLEKQNDTPINLFVCYEKRNYDFERKKNAKN